MSTTPLDHRHDLTLYPVAPFNFAGTVHKPSHFPSADTAFDGTHYWRTMRWDGHVLGLKMTDTGTVDAPAVALSVYADAPLPAAALDVLADEITRRYDFGLDLAPFERAVGSDPLMAPVLARWRGMRVMTDVSLYEYLVIATVLQQATVRRSVQMLDALFRAYGSVVAFDGRELAAFWAPETLDSAPEEDLRALKVGYRAKQLKRQAAQAAAGALDEAELRVMSSPDLKRRLLAIYGIGPASVWYLMFEVFKRYDALDTISPWEQKIYSKLLFDQELANTAEILDEVKRRWGDWRMLAVHYLFEDLFWRRKHEPVPWLEALIRL